MIKIIQLNREELHATLSEIVREAISAKEEKKPMLPDRITDLKEVQALTSLSRSAIYKKTASGEIPCSKFGNKKLVFSRKELLAWVESRTVVPANNHSLVVDQLAKSANKKGRK